MDSARFDDLLRSLASGLSRRATLSALASSIFGAGSLVLLDDDTEAKRRRKRKKKKKTCKSGTKKCGKTCIPATGCCTSSACGANGTCVGNTCSCVSGFKNCEGECIPATGCCSASECGAHGACVGHTCQCASGFKDCEGTCIANDECCDDLDCPGGFMCLHGTCFCPDTDEIACGDQCCDTTLAEICDATDPDTAVCEGGGCLGNDWCNEFNFYLCANNAFGQCVCLSTVEDEIECVNLFTLTDDADCNVACDSGLDCPLGSVCVPGNGLAGGRCPCANNFCASVC